MRDDRSISTDPASDFRTLDIGSIGNASNVPSEPLAFRVCTEADVPELLRLAQVALSSDTFYSAAFGFDAQALEAYWRAYFRMVLTDPSSEVVALAAGSRLVACGALGYHGFPAAENSERFDAELRTVLTPRQHTSFARFLAAYEDVMAAPEEQSRVEAQVLWLFVEQPRRGTGLVAKMLGEWRKQHRAAGLRVLCGLVNAGAPAVIDSYRRIGFRCGEPILSFGLRLARVTLDLGALSPTRGGA